MTRTPSSVRILLVGAGNRGSEYARFCASFPDRAVIVGVAEPRTTQRERIAQAHGIPPDRQFNCWTDAAALPRFADAVIIATQDRMHTGPAVAFARLGYHLLLEKPMAPDEQGCRSIVDAVRSSGVLMAVCHVLRYTAYTRELKRLLAERVIGDVISVQHLEPVGYWHQAHSFVRGNWRNEQESTFMLMAKSCHDLDWLLHIVDRDWESVSSFGDRTHFRRENQPARASDRCVDCAVEAECPYSAPRIYGRFLRKGLKGWPLEILTDDITAEGLDQALRTGPYGRCVYACDNDVVDHQAVNIRFAGGLTASFTMTAFSAAEGRQTRIFGSKGEIVGDSRHLRIRRFLTDAEEVIDTRAGDQSILGGHGGGDGGLMDAFLDAVARKDGSRIISGCDASWNSHRLVFAAEQSRRTGQTITIEPRDGDHGASASPIPHRS